MNILKFEGSKATLVGATIQRRLIRTNNLMTVIVDFSGGPMSEPDPYHSHPHEQTCYIAYGEVLFLEEGEEPVRLKAGDLFAVASGKKHAIQLLTPTARLIDSFNPIREDFL
ncbi:cupin domain-containing protein [Massilibacteroides sp.]|uniref:cupin domain-containing protein n=1 Tax=Massilibacteroides sp. TaxID=2034766 RepID=UPI0026391707|nr:cupin domain-containing protein [Massilibacteroides sp.]MDD4516599.1 cupin domain-containing protein [Massilibacteroides sp.]